MASRPSEIALKAAFDGNLSLLKKMASKVDLRGAKDAMGNTALHLAATKGCLESCRFLVEESGIDVNSVTKTGETPMLYAAQEGNLQVMRYLLDRGGDPAMPDERGSTPLHDAALEVKIAAAHGRRDLVEVLFSGTKPIPSMPDWSVDGIIRTVNSPHISPFQTAVSLEEEIADCKSRGKEAFAKEGYFAAMSFYGQVLDIDPSDAAMYSNHSLCWLRMGHGELALEDARKCRMMRPSWSKAWYREGAALSFMKDYDGAADAFQVALQLDPKCEEIREALRKAEKAAE